MRLYLFDFDGTLTVKDTLFDFLKYSFPQEYKITYIKFIPLFVFAKLKLVNTAKTKEKFISSFLKGKTRQQIEELAQKYFNSKKDVLLRKKGVEYIKNIEANKYIVTASLNLWVKPFADYFGMKLISTQAEFKNEVFTGNFLTENCNHKEKVIRITKEIKLSDYDEIYAFGDTKGDKYMLELATHPHFRYFEEA